MMTTKWCMISNDERARLDNTPCKITCTGCGLWLATEGDSARHFTMTDQQDPWQGTCPRAPLVRKAVADLRLFCTVSRDQAAQMLTIWHRVRELASHERETVLNNFTT